MLIDTIDKIERLDWEKMSDLMPAIVQHAFDGRVLMQGFMNRESLAHTLESGKVTFWSRSRKTLWTKGETSGNTLRLESIHSDCDGDCLLVLAHPDGPTCHLGTQTCFDSPSPAAPQLAFLAGLEGVIRQRHRTRPEGSYTTRLFDSGTKRIAQKVGEEGVETALAAATGNREELQNEAADLLYHLLVLLRDSDTGLSDVIRTLESRHG